MFKTCITTIALAILSMTAVTTKAQSYPTRLLDHESQINEIIKAQQEKNADRAMDLLNRYIKNEFAISQLFHTAEEAHPEND